MAAKYSTHIAEERPIEETMDLYKKWSTSYDEEVKFIGQRGAEAIVEVFSKLNVDKNSRILDIGAGTGTIGILLKDLGFTNVDALDGCKEMLEISVSKNAYNQYMHAVITKEKPIPINDSSYDVLIMGAVMGPGHLGPYCFEEFVRIVRKGGLVCWAMRDPKLYSERSDVFKGDYFLNQVELLCNRKLWKYFVPGPIPLKEYNVNVPGFAFIMQVL